MGKFILVVILFAAVVYLLVRLWERRSRRKGGGGNPARPQPPRPMGPDDDPDFIWDLNKKFRQPRKPGDGPQPS